MEAQTVAAIITGQHTIKFDDYTVIISRNDILSKYLEQISNELSSSEVRIIVSALSERAVLANILIDNETKCLISFAICHKVDYDPFNNHIIPSCLDFIYTFTKYRRNGYALKLLECMLRCKLELTAFTTNKISKKFFKKAGFMLMGAKNKCLVMQSNETDEIKENIIIC